MVAFPGGSPDLVPLPQLANECFAELCEFCAQSFRHVWASKVLKLIHPHVCPAQVSGSHSVPSLGLTLRRAVSAVISAPLEPLHPSSSVLSLIFSTGAPLAAGGGSLFKQGRDGFGS